MVELFQNVAQRTPENESNGGTSACSSSFASVVMPGAVVLLILVVRLRPRAWLSGQFDAV
jgi:hypothetical protein